MIIAPQLPAFGGDVWNSRADQVKAIARSTADKYQGNPSQIYLTGFSYGGNGVLDIGFRQRYVSGLRYGLSIRRDAL